MSPPGPANGANVTYNQAANSLFANVVSGSGSFTKAGAGMLTLTSASNCGYTGATNITGGTLKIQPPLQSLPVTTTRSTTDTFGVGTRIA